MMKILYIDACPRKESRTRYLADKLTEKIIGTLSPEKIIGTLSAENNVSETGTRISGNEDHEYQLERLVLSEEDIPELDDEAVQTRDTDCRNSDFTRDVYRYAKQFAESDIIIIAAPFWDMSFPAVLKKYIETITVTGITFRYSEEGYPIGLCRGRKLYYVTTAGGKIFNEEYGYGYIKAMATGMYGISECKFIKAENLDVIGNNPEEIIAETIKSMSHCLL